MGRGGREALVKLLGLHPKMLDRLLKFKELRPGVSLRGLGSLPELGVLRAYEQSQQMLCGVGRVDCCLSQSFEKGARRLMCRHDALHDRPKEVNCTFRVQVAFPLHGGRLGQHLGEILVLALRELEEVLNSIAMLQGLSHCRLYLCRGQGGGEAAAEMAGSSSPPPVSLEEREPVFPRDGIYLACAMGLGGGIALCYRHWADVYW